MGFNLSDLYEQTGLAFFTLTNLVVGMAYMILMLPTNLYKDCLDFLIEQVVRNGQMQSGNISIIFVGVLSASFLFSHLSNWSDEVLPLFMNINIQEFKLLIASAFWNISELYNQNEKPKRKVFSDTIQESLGRIFSVEHPESTQYRMLAGRQMRWRIYKNYSGTFKLIVWVSLILSTIQPTFWSFSYYLLLAGSAELLWFAVNVLLCRLLWDMLYSYWYMQESARIKPETYLDKVWRRDYSRYSYNSVKMSRLQKRMMMLENLGVYVGDRRSAQCIN